jgi:peptidoglycan/xylan/chitin deacetylase (PgdA/CDA1 family)
MYHELTSEGRPLCRRDKGYARYCLPELTFRSQLAWLRTQGYEGWTVSQALYASRTHEAGVAITFDDGCETDLLDAAPALLDAGFNATFFIVSTWVGRPGYLSRGQLRELRACGFEIGAHSRTHVYLTDQRPALLQSEIAGSKGEIEQLLGESVKHFSCPGGRWSPAVADAARDAGFQTVSTSRIGTVNPLSDRFSLPRVAIVDGMRNREFEAVCRGRTPWLREAESTLLAGAKRLMGNSLYEKMREAVLSR